MSLTNEYQAILKDNLITLLNLELLGEEKKFEIIGRTQELVEKRTMLRVLDLLNDTDKEMVKKAEKNGTLMEYITQRIPNISEIILEEVARVKLELVEAKSALK